MTQEILLKQCAPQDVSVDADPVLHELITDRETLRRSIRPIGQNRGGGDDWDAPLDVRVSRPRAVDLETFWRSTNQKVPPVIAASLGRRKPILINHVITPFAKDGRLPANVWALGYEFIAKDIEADTVAVLPNDDVLKVGTVGQEMSFGLDLAGGVALPEGSALEEQDGPSISLTGARLRAATHQAFHFSLRLELTFRRVVGAPTGIGGAAWKMYRQNERLDRSHALLQTVLVDEGAQHLDCSVRVWATQAGVLGTGWGAKFWPYADQDFRVDLRS